MIVQESSEAPDNGHNGGIDLDCVITDIEISERMNKDLLSPERPQKPAFFKHAQSEGEPPRNRNVGSRSVSGRKSTISYIDL